MIRAMVGVITLFPGSAFGFCGLYVSEPGTTIENHGSAVLYANHDGVTAITIAADFTGDTTDFGLLVPIPQAIGERDVRVVGADLFTRLDAYSTPRLVSYPEFPYDYANYDLDADADGVADEVADGVDVEARFEVGVFDVAVLATDDARALSAWLEANDFAAPVDQGGILQGYIDRGQHFLAARVDTCRASEPITWLPPLQFSYPGEVSGLPIRIGTLSASGPQELTVYTITDLADGEVRIANYPEVTVTDECLWQPAGTESLDRWYRATLDEAFAGEAGWIKEYGIAVVGVASCDPCTGAPMYIEELAEYGWTGALSTNDGGTTGASAYLTRLRVRYTPEQADEDLVFDAVGDDPMSQIRYVVYEEWLTDEYDVCPNPVLVSEVGQDDAGDVLGDDPSPATCTDLHRWWRARPGDCSCSAAPPTGALSAALLLAAGLVAARRKR